MAKTATVDVPPGRGPRPSSRAGRGEQFLARRFRRCLAGGFDRWIPTGSHCGIPPDATSVAANFTVVDPNAPGALNAYPTGVARPTTSVVVFSLGDNLLTIWEADGLDGSLYGVFARILSPSGDLLSGVFKVNDYTEHDQRQPAAAGGRDGRALVAWSSVGQGAGRAAIYSRLVHTAADPLEDPLGAEFPISESADGLAQNPQVAAFPGGYWVAWEVLDDNAQTSSLRLRRLNRDGQPLGREIELRAAEREQVQLVELEGPGGNAVGVRWWRLGPGKEFLGAEVRQVGGSN